MPAQLVAQKPLIPEGKEFIRGWTVPNVGFIDYGHSFYRDSDRHTPSSDGKQKFGEYFESRWESYGKMAGRANLLFNNGRPNGEKLIDVAETSYALARELKEMPKLFPAVFDQEAPVKSMKTREALLYNYWRRPVEELYLKTAAVGQIFGDAQVSARGLNVLLTDLETDGINPSTLKATENGFRSTLSAFFRGYVEIIESLKAVNAAPEVVGTVYRAYGELVHSVVGLVSTKYPAALPPLKAELASQIGREYTPDKRPAASGFYRDWNPHPQKTRLIEQIEELAAV